MMKVIIFWTLIFLPLLAESQIKTLKPKEIKFLDYYSNAVKDYLLNNYTQATQDLTNALKYNEKSAASYYLYAKIYFQQNNFDIAKIYIKKAIKLDKKNIWYKNLLAQIYIIEDDFKNAEKLYREIIKSSPDAEFFKQLIQIYLRQQQFELAKIYAIKYTKKYGFSPQINDVLLHLYKLENDTSELKTLLTKLIKLYPNNATYTEEYVRILEKSSSSSDLLMLYKKNQLKSTLYLPVLKIYIQKNRLDSAKYVCKKIIVSKLPLDIKLKSIELIQKKDKSYKTINQLYKILFVQHPNSNQLCLQWLSFLNENHLIEKSRVVGLKCLDSIKNDLVLYKYLDTILILNKSYNELFSVDSAAILYFPNEPEFFIYSAIAQLNLNHINISKQYLSMAKSLDISSQYDSIINFINSLQCYLETHNPTCLTQLTSTIKKESNCKQLLIFQAALENFPEVRSKLNFSTLKHCNSN